MQKFNLPAVVDGCDTSGPTAERPKNAECGALYHDTCLDALLVKLGDGWRLVNEGEPPLADDKPAKKTRKPRKPKAEPEAEESPESDEADEADEPTELHDESQQEPPADG